MSKHRPEFTETHVPTKTCRDTFIEVRALSRRGLIAGLETVIERETLKGEIVTFGSGKTSLSLRDATSAPHTYQGRYHVETLRIRRETT
jgi:UTP:GlnB (protein PII) uridylyltransferase